MKVVTAYGHRPNLIWENGVVGSRLLVVTWLGTAGSYYKCSNPAGCAGNSSCIEGGECPTYSYDSWVTVVPEIRIFFGISVPQPLRIAQLLVLPPEYGVFKTYSSWFTNRTRYGYTRGSSPYPWTRLGYTYDWGSSNHTGLSEFVLHGRKVDRSTISVGIKSVKTPAEYFQLN